MSFKANMALLILLMLTGSLYSQVLEEELRMEGDSVQIVEKIDVLSPSRAAFYSAILPGLGQAYNGKYWKIPIVYGAIGTGLYFVKWNADELDRYETAYKQRLAGQEDEFDGEDGNPYISTDGLVRAQNQYKKNRDLSIFVTLGLYALNIIEANVDAHLDDKAFNKQLSLRPSFYYDTTMGASVAGVYLKYDLNY